ncbi:hypothetical protein [Streptomyces sp. NPDC093261]|uniref:hypothetical protein n=1 Tax=Streptomyces sp. NPDC093261 TaxID=3366037 RepID=UPI0037F54C23
MLASLGTMPEPAHQLSGLRSCTQPLRLDGHRTECAVNKTTGEIGNVLRHLDSAGLPAGQRRLQAHALASQGEGRTYSSGRSLVGGWCGGGCVELVVLPNLPTIVAKRVRTERAETA